MSEATARRVAEWLLALGNVPEAKPVRAVIGGVAYFGASYRQVLHYQAGMRIVAEGGKKAGEAYTVEGLLLAGRPPGKDGSGGKHAFPMDGREWYVTHWGSGSVPGLVAFGLQPWDVPSGEKIDAHERKPYTRLPMTVEAV